MKSKEELNQLTNEVEALGTKLNELTDDELKTVVGGFIDGVIMQSNDNIFVKFIRSIPNIKEVELRRAELVKAVGAIKGERQIEIPDVNGGNLVVNKVD